MTERKGMTMTERKGEWFVTYTGRRFYPFDPRVADIDIKDIAHSLSLQTRWLGHCKTHYSIASHSLACARVAEMGAQPPEVVRWCFMHDASEAYVGDVIRPIKRSLWVADGPNTVEDIRMFPFKTVEDRIHKLIAERFKLPWSMPAMVHEIDNRMLMTEALHLTNYMRDPHWVHEKPWADVKPYAGDHVLLLQSMTSAEEAFLARAKEYLEL